MINNFAAAAGATLGFAVVFAPVWVALNYFGVSTDGPFALGAAAFFGALVGSGHRG